MESILNILWVLIALVALSVWRVRRSRNGRGRRHDMFREWTAIACALILLFFAVSLTDDLHFGLALFDECSCALLQPAVWTAPDVNDHGAKQTHSCGADALPKLSPPATSLNSFSGRLCKLGSNPVAMLDGCGIERCAAVIEFVDSVGFLS
jgi:hypothetical protein